MRRSRSHGRPSSLAGAARVRAGRTVRRGRARPASSSATPRAWQVVQRDAQRPGGHRRLAAAASAWAAGSVSAWGGWRATARCDRAGRFTARPGGRGRPARPRCRCGVRGDPASSALPGRRRRRHLRHRRAEQRQRPEPVPVRLLQPDAARRDVRQRLPLAGAARPGGLPGGAGRHGQRGPRRRRLRLAGGGHGAHGRRGRAGGVRAVRAHEHAHRALAAGPARPGGRPARSTASMARRVAAVGGRVRAVLWWQGERGRALPHARRPSTRRRSGSLADAVWRDFGAPLVVAQIGDYGDAVHRGRRRRRAPRPGSRPGRGRTSCQGPVLYDIDLHGEVHFLDAGRRGRRGPALGGGHPRAACCTATPARTPAPGARGARGRPRSVLTADSRRSPPGADLGGFVVRGDGRPVRRRERVRRRRHRPPAAGRARRGPARRSRSARAGPRAGAAVPTDTSAWRLPMLPVRGAPGEPTATP